MSGRPAKHPLTAFVSWLTPRVAPTTRHHYLVAIRRALAHLELDGLFSPFRLAVYDASLSRPSHLVFLGAHAAFTKWYAEQTGETLPRPPRRPQTRFVHPFALDLEALGVYWDQLPTHTADVFLGLPPADRKRVAVVRLQRWLTDWPEPVPAMPVLPWDASGEPMPGWAVHAIWRTLDTATHGNEERLVHAVCESMGWTTASPRDVLRFALLAVRAGSAVATRSNIDDVVEAVTSRMEQGDLALAEAAFSTLVMHGEPLPPGCVATWGLPPDMAPQVAPEVPDGVPSATPVPYPTGASPEDMAACDDDDADAAGDAGERAAS